MKNLCFLILLILVMGCAPGTQVQNNTYTLEPSGSGAKLTTGMEEMVKGQLKGALDTGNAALKKLIEA